jgi:hypothetical protein
MRFARRITKARDTEQQWLSERASVLRYMCVASLVKAHEITRKNLRGSSLQHLMFATSGCRKKLSRLWLTGEHDPPVNMLRQVWVCFNKLLYNMVEQKSG